MMTRKILLSFLILGTFLLTSVYADQPIIEDESPVNFYWFNTIYEYRDYGTSSFSNTGGADSRTGAYFKIDASIKIVPGQPLGNLADIDKVKVMHLDTGQEYSLQQKDLTWLVHDLSEWYLNLRPEDWMFEGTWEFTLTYYDSRGKMHRQIKERVLARPTFPPKISNIMVEQISNEYKVSWSAIGNPGMSPPYLDYRVHVFNESYDTGLEDYKGKWRGGSDGIYDNEVNRVTFTIPCGYGGEGFIIRLVNRIWTVPNPPQDYRQLNRAQYYMKLPECTP